MRDLWGLEPEGLADARPWLDHGKWNPPHNRSARLECLAARRCLRLPDRRGRKPAPDRGGPRACGHHRAWPLPLHGERRGRGATRGAPWLRAQGHRVADGRHVGRARRGACGARLGRQHRGLRPRLRPRGRGGARHRSPAARRLAARVDGRARTARQSFRRHRRDLQRCRLRHDARALRAICASRCCASRTVLRSPADDGSGGARRRADATCREGASSSFAPCCTAFAAAFPELVELYDNTASLQDRTVGTGILSAGAGTAVRLRRLRRAGLRPEIRCATQARLSALRSCCNSTYRCWKTATWTRGSGFASARSSKAWRLIDQILQRAPARADRASAGHAPRRAAREGVALVEGFRGDVLVWVRTGVDGNIERCHVRDPSWFQWPVLEAAIEGNIVGTRGEATPAPGGSGSDSASRPAARPCLCRSDFERLVLDDLDEVFERGRALAQPESRKIAIIVAAEPEPATKPSSTRRKRSLPGATDDERDDADEPGDRASRSCAAR